MLESRFAEAYESYEPEADPSEGGSLNRCIACNADDVEIRNTWTLPVCIENERTRTLTGRGRRKAKAGVGVVGGGGGGDRGVVVIGERRIRGR